MNHPYTIIDTAVVRVGSLIDGTGRPARKDLFVRVEKGMVQALTDTVPSGPHDLIDLSGCTVLPCLIDSHVHLFLSGSLDSEKHRRQMAAGVEDACRTIAENIDCQQSCGVLTVRDGGDGRAHVSRFLRDRVEKGHSLFLAQTPGRGWFKAGRYGKLVGGEPLPESAFLEAITGQMAAGADHVKLVNSGLNSLTQFGVQTAPQFASEELIAIVAAARRAGRPVMVHANGEIPVRQAVEAGVDSIEHGYFMGTDNLLRMAERQTFWVPTLAPIHAFAQTTVDFSGVAARTLEHQMGQLAFARRVGVKVALGTDAGSPGVYHGTGVIRELELFMAAGYTMEEAVGCAAVCNADLLGLADRGRIAPGMPVLWAVTPGDESRLPASLGQVVVYAGKG